MNGVQGEKSEGSWRCTLAPSEHETPHGWRCLTAWLGGGLRGPIPGYGLSVLAAAAAGRL